MTLVVFVILCKICVRFLLLASSGGFLLPGAAARLFYCRAWRQAPVSTGSTLPGWQGIASLSPVPGPRVKPKTCPAATHGRIKKKGGFRRPKTLIHFWTNIHCADIRRRSHVNAGDDAHGKKHCDNRAAAIAEKRERQTDDRENAEADTDIDDRL